MSAGILLALLGPADTTAALPAKAYAWSRAQGDKNAALSDSGRLLIAWDLAADCESWRRDCGADISARMLAIRMEGSSTTLRTTTWPRSGCATAWSAGARTTATC